MPNRLAGETSPYLRQHAENPVDWYPWGPEALGKARAESKPILLSIGYSACHWCHVMAHESFESETIARAMNRDFVNIKLDREERPDLDAIYQSALALMGEQGGWPLTMFLTPEGKPFSGGTYFPPEPRYGRPGFPQVLAEIARVWREEPERVTRAQETLMPHLQRILNPSAPGELSLGALDQIAARLVKAIDPVFGGVGSAPKFPNTAILELLWRAYMRTGDEGYRSAVETSLVHMCQGGLFDHLGGGFHRYAVDREWLTPHFEKMLYDNAQLVSLMTLVWKKTRSPLLAQRIEETIQWLMREMRVGRGRGGCAFAASLDADSEGHEGRFYVWAKAEILDALGTDDGELFSSVYGVTVEGNFEGNNILNRLGALDLGDEAHEMRLKACREKLLSVRERRVRPGRDDKVLAEWNGLMIKALAEAGAAFGRPDWLKAADAALGEITNKTNVLTALPTAEAYANMVAAGLALDQAGGSLRAARWQAWLAGIEQRFSAPDGGFYQVPGEAGDVIIRSRTIYDGAVPPANAAMLANYAALHARSGDAKYRDRAEAIVRLFAGVALQTPAGTASFLNAFEQFVAPVNVFIAIPGREHADYLAEEGGALARAVLGSPDPSTTVEWVPAHAVFSESHPAFGKKPIDGKPTAYVCRGQACSAPVTEPAELARLLDRP